MKSKIYYILVAVLLLPSLALAAGGGDEKPSKGKGADKGAAAYKIEQLPETRFPALDDILDKAREKLERKASRDKRVRDIRVQEADRKSKIERRLEDHLGSDLPDVVPEAHKPGILDAVKEEVKPQRKLPRRRQDFVPISTNDIRDAFNKAGGDSLSLQRDGNDIAIDLLCNEKNEASLVKGLPQEKATGTHIRDARHRFCLK